jgi:cytidylate kinase
MAGSLNIKILQSQLIKMAMAADRTINVSSATITAKANNIIVEARLHRTMTMAYAIVTHSAIVVLLAVRIERVLRVACLGGGFRRVQ